MVRFFKKLSPDTPVVISDRQRILFTSIDNGLTGYFATDSPELAAEFERCMREQRSGVSEISAEEFHRDYVEPKKKGIENPSKPIWREEITGRSLTGSNPISNLGEEAVARAVAVPGGTTDIRGKGPPRPVGLSVADDSTTAQVAAAAAVPVPPPPKQEFAPKTAKRNKRATDPDPPTK